MRRAALSFVLLLAGCATAPNPNRDAAAIDEQIARTFRDRPDDAETLARLSPGNLVREGRTLTVRTGARTFRFIDAGYCEGFQTCERYRADRLFHGRFVGVSMVHGEYPDRYLVIDLARGTRLFDLGERPVPAPAAPLAALADAGQINDPIIGGLAVVDLERRRVLWHQPDWNVDAQIEGWEGSRCVRASYRPTLASDTRQSVWIVEDGSQWAAHEEPPPNCIVE